MAEPDACDLAACGAYRLLRLISAGGAGRVYEARDERIGRRVAVKVSHEVPTAQRRARFLREARLLGHVHHPGLVQVHDCGELPDGRVYLVLEYLEGPSLRAHLEASGPLPEPEVRSLGALLGDALGHLHARGVLHRDLKPDNVILLPDASPAGRVRIVDLGIAKGPEPEEPLPATLIQTDELSVLGTAAYMAPEQWRHSGAVTTAADVYSLGVLLYELVTGAPPFSGPDRMELMTQHLRDAPPPLAARRPGTSPELCALIEGMLAKDPARRPSVAETVAVLRTAPRRRIRLPWRPPRALLRVLGALAALALGLAGARHLRREAARERAEELRRIQEQGGDARSLRDIAGTVGPRRRALARALADAQRLHDRAPEDQAAALHLGRQELATGDLEAEVGDLVAARRAYGAARRLAEVALRSAPGAAGPAALLALTRAKEADVELSAGDLAAAGAGYGEARAALRALLQAAPADRERLRELSIACSGLAEVHAHRGEAAAACALYDESWALQERLAAGAPSDAPEARRIFAVLHGRLGDLAADEGDGAEAERRYRAALQLQQDLVAARPNHSGYERHLADLGRRLGLLLLSAGRRDEAGPLLTQALGRARQAAARDPEVPAARLFLAQVEAAQAEAAASAGRPAAAAWAEALSRARAVATERPEHGRWQHALLELEVRAARAAAPPERAAILRAATERLAQLRRDAKWEGDRHLAAATAALR